MNQENEEAEDCYTRQEAEDCYRNERSEDDFDAWIEEASER
jgi:hypothetical protein